MQLIRKIKTIYLLLPPLLCRLTNNFIIDTRKVKTVYLTLLMLIAFSLASPHLMQAQSLVGITGKQDSSYSNYSAFTSTLKTHPHVKLMPVLNLKHIRADKNIVYTKNGNNKLFMDAFYSASKPSQKRIPILMIHGGGWRSGNRIQHHALAEKLANLGYVCFTPAYRLSTEALFPAAVYDLKEAIRWVKRNASKYQIDSSKLVVAGFSAGGELAAFLGATGNMPLFEGPGYDIRISTTVKAVIDMDGILSFVHPESGEGDDSKRTSAATYWFGYSKQTQPKLWEAASTLSYIGPSTPPTLFINSNVDRMHAGRDDYRNFLKQFNIYTEVKTFADAPHSFPLFDPWFEPMVACMDQFIRKVIQ